MSFSVRVASPAEIRFYEETLYPLQDRVLAIAGIYRDQLVLTGGTALARRYFDHRYSEDIDLFTAVPSVQAIAHELHNRLRDAGLEVDMSGGTDQPGFVRAFVGSERLKIDIAADMPRLDAPVWDERLRVCVHTLNDLGGNKVSAYESRAEIKDVVDLYYLAKDRTWNELFRAADRKRVPIAYDALRFITTQPISGTLLSKTPLAFDVDEFVKALNGAIEEEVKKKRDEWSKKIQKVVADLLWDAPVDERTINSNTAAVLARRATQLPEPQRLALREVLARWSSSRGHRDRIVARRLGQ